MAAVTAAQAMARVAAAAQLLSAAENSMFPDAGTVAYYRDEYRKALRQYTDPFNSKSYG